MNAGWRTSRATLCESFGGKVKPLTYCFSGFPARRRGVSCSTIAESDGRSKEKLG
jgi:hypothetical protein